VGRARPDRPPHRARPAAGRRRARQHRALRRLRRAGGRPRGHGVQEHQQPVSGHAPAGTRHRHVPARRPDGPRWEDPVTAQPTGPETVPATLVLEDGRVFRGRSFGARGETFGEIVFNTGMTGYQETLTDPSYHRQIVTMTAPHIGNTGVNDDDPESGRIWVAGYVVREPARVPSNWRAQRTLDEELRRQGVVGIAVDGTRALTRHLRDRGAMRAVISTEEHDPAR